ncbi:MAG UNVERIFIED_CONTAM: flagellar biosynthetic protein FliR [Rickettsiaceae bacterium]|jgi:flagellar biosynthetic protein FliR
MLEKISLEFVMSLSLIFARISSSLYLFPGLSSNYILMQGRLHLAILTSIILYPILIEHMPQYPITTSQYLTYLIVEIIIGIIITIAAKIYFTALDTVGTIISMQSGLSAATFFDPNQGEQVSIITSFLTLTAYTMIFVTDTHYLFFEAIIDSYNLFDLGSFPEIGDLGEFISNAVNQAFILAFKLVSPFITVSLGFLISNGVLSRLMPNLQVFFVVTPVQIFVMFIILFIMINLMMGKFIEALRGVIYL